MLKKNPLQFSVVREDPEVELALFQKFGIKNPILIGSGGCTALAIASRYPEVTMTLIDPNPAQIKLIKDKMRVLKSSSKTQLSKKFGVLIEQGNFESLFRSLRNFIYEFIADEKQIEKLLLSGKTSEWKSVFKHPYWSVAFDLYFNNSILLAMFGPAAIQHAPPESYSKHFRLVFEKGLLRSDRSKNYFLHHLLLGHYPKSKSGWPIYLQNPPKNFNVKFRQCMANEVSDYSPYDFVGLSNIYDWSSESQVRALSSKLNRELKVGAVVLYRQLNNRKNFESAFGRSFQWFKKEATKLHGRDRSLFYSSIHIGRKTK